MSDLKKPIYLFATSTSTHATNVKSLDIKLLKPEIDFANYDCLIITSKQTIKALRQYDSQNFLSKPSICVSQKTAASFLALGGNVVGVGDGYGDSLFSLVTSEPKSVKWLYLRGDAIASDFAQKARKNGHIVDEKIVYTSGCSQEILATRVEPNATLIFTSPSAVECFLKNNHILPTNTIIVIGTTTATALPAGVAYAVGEKTTIESCIDLALKV